MTKDNKESFLYTIGEECLNAISHGVGAILSLIGLIVLIIFAASEGSSLEIFSAVIYGSSLFILYLFSTLYHSLSRTKAKNLFQKFDHISIYLLIAGTYTPIALCAVGGSSGWWLFSFVWVTAVLGIIFKAVFGTKYNLVSTILYVFMGWSVLFVIKTLIQNVSLGGLVLLFLGGFFYTAGVYFYLKGDTVKWWHGVWHFFVTAGSISNYFAVLIYII